MVFVSGLLTNCSGLIHCHPKVPFKSERHNSIRFSDYNAFGLASRTATFSSFVDVQRARIRYSRAERFDARYVMSVGRNHGQLSFDDDLYEEPFWLSLIKETLWGLKSLFVFLVEQPSQLKYIEWPGFGSTLKTATLTLVLVAALIVALASVDSALSFLLALILRRTP